MSAHCPRKMLSGLRWTSTMCARSHTRQWLGFGVPTVARSTTKKMAVLSWANIEETRVVKRVQVLLLRQSPSYVCGSEHVLSLRRLALFACFHNRKEKWSPLLEEENWKYVRQKRMCVAVTVADIRNMAEVVRSISERRR